MKTMILRNGVEMPMIGFGTMFIREDSEPHILSALKLGYRLIDTAASYESEAAVGRAIRESGIPREEIFITTKLWIQDAGYDKTLEAFRHSLYELQTDYIDLYLIHHPYGDYYGAWRAMQKLMQEGYIRAIGVSNFSPERLVDISLNSDIAPMVNQIECHPFFHQRELLHEMQKYGVMPQAWAPLCEGQKDIFNHPVLTEIAQAHGTSAAQVILQWNLQNGIAVIPRSSQEAHRLENISLGDFTLTDEEMQQISGMDMAHSELVDYCAAHTARQLIGWKIHA